jgi:hypothetical protein
MRRPMPYVHETLTERNAGPEVGTRGQRCYGGIPVTGAILSRDNHVAGATLSRGQSCMSRGQRCHGGNPVTGATLSRGQTCHGGNSVTGVPTSLYIPLHQTVGAARAVIFLRIKCAKPLAFGGENSQVGFASFVTFSMRYRKRESVFRRQILPTFDYLLRYCLRRKRLFNILYMGSYLYSGSCRFKRNLKFYILYPPKQVVLITSPEPLPPIRGLMDFPLTSKSHCGQGIEEFGSKTLHKRT